MARHRRPKAQRQFDQLALALGNVCIAWGRIEQDLNEFIEKLAPLNEGDISRSITANLDIRSKIQTIKALAYLRGHSESWFKEMVLILDYIDNNLRPRRNRFIHAGWYIPKGRLTRRTYQIKFERPQSFQLRLQTQSNISSTVREVKQLGDELDDLFLVMFTAWYNYAYPQHQRALPPTYRRRFLRRARRSIHVKRANSKPRSTPTPP
jgi:hypothetical protein